MRVAGTVASLVLLLPSAFAADLKIKVVDPNSASVVGAQVSILPAEGSTPIQRAVTSGEGLASIPGLLPGRYRVQVLAAGFSAFSADVSVLQSSAFTATLSISSVTETVVVSATRSPAPVDETGASVSSLESGELKNMQPVALADAIRFLPGAVVNSAGQRGGLASSSCASWAAP